MGKVKKFKKIKSLKWHTQKEKRQKLEETKEELIIKPKLRKLLYVRKQGKAIFTIEPIGMKVNFTTEVKCCLIIQALKLNAYFKIAIS